MGLGNAHARRGITRSIALIAVIVIMVAAAELTSFLPSDIARVPRPTSLAAAPTASPTARADSPSTDLAGATAASGFYDNFKTDTSLDSSIWTTSGAVATTYGPNVSTPGAALVQPVLTFSKGNGMQFSNVTGYFEVSLVQSVQSYSPPFYGSAGVSASADFGNAASLAIVSADGSEGTGIFGNIDPNNTGYYGINYIFPLLYHNHHNAIVASPTLNTWYDYNISVTSAGTASLVVSSAGATLGTSPNLSVGTGPFYIWIFEFEGAPNIAGSDFVNWSYASEGVLASSGSSSGSSGSGFSSWWWVLLVIVIVVVFLVLVRIRRRRTGRAPLLHGRPPVQGTAEQPPAR